MSADLAGELSRAGDWDGEWTGEWAGDETDRDLTGALRSALRDAYAGASEADMQDALDNVLDAMSPAEGFNFGAALGQIGKSAQRLVSDPAFVQIARTVAPIAGGAIGSLGGPLGTALGTQLGSLAAGALAAPPTTPAPRPTAPPAGPGRSAAPPPAAGLAAAAPAAAAPAPAAAVPALPLPVPASPVAGGSAAAAQGLVLTQQPDVLRSLLATALGQHGRREINGIPAAQVLSMISQVFGQAAADADELMYLEQRPGAEESGAAGPPGDAERRLYSDLLGADNLELAEAAGLDGLA